MRKPGLNRDSFSEAELILKQDLMKAIADDAFEIILEEASREMHELENQRILETRRLTFNSSNRVKKGTWLFLISGVAVFIWICIINYPPSTDNPLFGGFLMISILWLGFRWRKKRIDANRRAIMERIECINYDL